MERKEEIKEMGVNICESLDNILSGTISALNNLSKKAADSTAKFRKEADGSNDEYISSEATRLSKEIDDLIIEADRIEKETKKEKFKDKATDVIAGAWADISIAYENTIKSLKKEKDELEIKKEEMLKNKKEKR